MKKLIGLFILCLLMIIPVSAESGRCGDDLQWDFSGHTLTVVGSGPMDDFEDAEGAPWYAHKDSIETVVMSGVTYVGTHAFEDYDSLTTVVVGDQLTQLGAFSFHNCDELPMLCLPKTFKIFGEECLSGCPCLESVYCAGGFPSFKGNCLWNTYVEIFYLTTNAWSQDLIETLEGNFSGRIRFFPTDHIPEPNVEVTAIPQSIPEETQPTQAPQETIPETTVPETTAAETIAAETTVPETAAPVETTAAPTETTAVTEAPAPSTEATVPTFIDTPIETTQEVKSAHNPTRESESSDEGFLIALIFIVAAFIVIVVALIIVVVNRRSRWDEE